MNPEWKNRYEAALLAAQKAGQLARSFFDTDFTVELKADRSPVTIADREAESQLRSRLQKQFPNDGFLGEEFGDQPGTSGFRWIIDPIDATRNFVRRIPIWATLVGLEYKGEQIAGVVEMPAMGQTYHALRGHGAFRDNRRIHVSTMHDLARSTIFYTSISWFAKAGRDGVFMELVRRTETQRGYGDFYGHVLVAEGAGEIMVEHGVHIWDVAAIRPIVEEAGGRFTDWDGHPAVDRPDVLISNGLVHDEVLTILKKK
ncbi:MAG TPA: inositol monophosphatase family protein [Gemmataceae bacterium]|nr:inositol monophosphatase family protein [Gemmataceae bacterium]